MKKDNINVGVIGWGVVGSGVVKILLNQSEFMRQTEKFSITLRRIFELDTTTTTDNTVVATLPTSD